jgi:glycine cleavage system H lipoate-binding protein
LKSPELQAKLKQASDPESLCQLAVQLGNEMGYNFTIEQVRAALAIEAAMGGEYLEVGDPLSRYPLGINNKPIVYSG